MGPALSMPDNVIVHEPKEDPVFYNQGGDPGYDAPVEYTEATEEQMPAFAKQNEGAFNGAFGGHFVSYYV